MTGSDRRRCPHPDETPHCRSRRRKAAGRRRHRPASRPEEARRFAAPTGDDGAACAGSVVKICAAIGATGIPAVCWLQVVNASTAAFTTTGGIAGAALTAVSLYVGRRH